MASSWDLDAVLKAQPARLSYSIHSTSGVYASFHPDHIRTDNPHSDTSRWTAPPPDHRRNPSSASSTVGTKRRRDPEWIILQLDHTALVRTIGFGKTAKPHPCNLADFTLWGGLSPDPLAMEPLLDSTLKNDANPERFSLPISLPSGGSSSTATATVTVTAPLPVRYLKIDCHVAANAAYSISIWHVWLEGYLASSSPSSSPLAAMSTATLESLYRAHRSRETTRLVLAHLRRAGPATLPAYRALAATLPSPSPSTSSPTSASSPAAPAGALEHPLLSALHDALVLEGDHARAESLLERIRRAGLLDEHCPGGGKGDSVARWVRLDAPGATESGKAAPGLGPSGRGGHAMVRVGRRVLLFGGWDGREDLGDLWEWSLDGHGGWRCLDDGSAAGEEGGPSALKPGPRSCHQMAVDEAEGWVYLLGGRRDELDDDDEDEDEDGEANEAGAEPASTTAAAAAMDVDADPPSSTAPSRPARASPTSSSPPTALDRALSRLQRRAARWRSDFWRYRAVGPGRGTWELLSADTRRDGGPALLFDHAMVVHSSARRLFVFGGKNQPFDAEAAGGAMGGGAGAAAMDDFGAEAGSAAGGGGAQREGRYSGMWCYDIEARRWTHLFGDPRPTSFAPRPASPSLSERLLSRAGHALVLDESSPDDDPTLYVLHGQRNEQYLADEWAVRLASPSSSSVPNVGSSSATRGAEGDDALWRQGAVLDFPSSAPSSAGSLVDASAFPASSPSASPSRPSRSTRTDADDSRTASSRSRQPTIVQIRRLPAPTDAAAAVPPAGFTQRLTLGPHGTWTFLTGLGAAPTGSGSASSGGSTPERDRERERARERGEGEERCVRGVWRRVGGPKGSWEKVKEEEGAAGEGPRGRYAAQVVYDPLKGEHYLFGGCPEAPLPSESPDMRLSDFWKLKIVDPTPDEALRRAKFLVRKQRFAELCATSPTVLALQYLQNDLSLVVDHSSPSESAAFRACMAQLLAAPARMNIDADAALLAAASRPATPSEGADEGACDVGEATYAARHALWEELGAFVPRNMRQPDERLDDAARLLRVWGMGGWGALGRS